MEYKKGDLFEVSYYDDIAKVIYQFEQGELITFTGNFDFYGTGILYEMENSVGNIEWMMEEDFTPCDDAINNTYETIKKKIKEYKEEEEYVMNYEKGDLFKVVKEIPNVKALKVGQIVELIIVGSGLFTVKDDKGRSHYVPFDSLEYYDELASAPLSKEVEEEFVHIMDFHKENYINKCLDEGNFEGLENL